MKRTIHENWTRKLAVFVSLGFDVYIHPTNITSSQLLSPLKTIHLHNKRSHRSQQSLPGAILLKIRQEINSYKTLWWIIHSTMKFLLSYCRDVKISKTSITTPLPSPQHIELSKNNSSQKAEEGMTCVNIGIKFGYEGFLCQILHEWYRQAISCTRRSWVQEWRLSVSQV